jgi:hypothetical protein
MNKERQVSLYDANRETIKLWIRKHKALKHDPNTKNTEILESFGVEANNSTCLNSPQGLHYIILYQSIIIGVHKIA